MPASWGARAQRLAVRLGVDDVPLDDARFRRMFAAEAISLLGTRVAPVALVFAVLDFSDAAGVGIVLAARQVPLVALLQATLSSSSMPGRGGAYM